MQELGTKGASPKSLPQKKPFAQARGFFVFGATIARLRPLHPASSRAKREPALSEVEGDLGFRLRHNKAVELSDTTPA